SIEQIQSDSFDRRPKLDRCPYFIWEGASGDMQTIGAAHLESLVLDHLRFDLWQFHHLTPLAAPGSKSLQTGLTLLTLLRRHNDGLIGIFYQAPCAACMTCLPSWFLPTLLRASLLVFLAYPSVEGGLLLLLLSLARRPNSSCTCMLNSSIRLSKRCFSMTNSAFSVASCVFSCRRAAVVFHMFLQLAIQCLRLSFLRIRLRFFLFQLRIFGLELFYD